MELKPEIEALIQKQLQSGAFSSVEESSNARLNFLAPKKTGWLITATRLQPRFKKDGMKRSGAS